MHQRPQYPRLLKQFNYHLQHLLKFVIVLSSMVLSVYSSSCPAGFLPPACQQNCPHGVYGLNCASKCSSTCFNFSCRPDNGICLRCRTGFRGRYCRGLCLPGSYGQDCRQSCGKNCLSRICDAFTGACPACVSGFLGTRCDLKDLRGDKGIDTLRGNENGKDSTRDETQASTVLEDNKVAKDSIKAAQRKKEEEKKRKTEIQAFYTVVVFTCATIPICFVSVCLYVVRKNIKKLSRRRKQFKLEQDGDVSTDEEDDSAKQGNNNDADKSPFILQDSGNNHGSVSTERSSKRIMYYGTNTSETPWRSNDAKRDYRKYEKNIISLHNPKEEEAKPKPNTIKNKSKDRTKSRQSDTYVKEVHQGDIDHQTQPTSTVDSSWEEDIDITVPIGRHHGGSMRRFHTKPVRLWRRVFDTFVRRKHQEKKKSMGIFSRLFSNSNERNVSKRFIVKKDDHTQNIQDVRLPKPDAKINKTESHLSVDNTEFDQLVRDSLSNEYPNKSAFMRESTSYETADCPSRLGTCENQTTAPKYKSRQVSAISSKSSFCLTEKKGSTSLSTHFSSVKINTRSPTLASRKSGKTSAGLVHDSVIVDVSHLDRLGTERSDNIPDKGKLCRYRESSKSPEKQRRFYNAPKKDNKPASYSSDHVYDIDASPVPGRYRPKASQQLAILWTRFNDKASKTFGRLFKWTPRNSNCQSISPRPKMTHSFLATASEANYKHDITRHGLYPVQCPKVKQQQAKKTRRFGTATIHASPKYIKDFKDFVHEQHQSFNCDVRKNKTNDRDAKNIRRTEPTPNEYQQNTKSLSSPRRPRFNLLASPTSPGRHAVFLNMQSVLQELINVCKDSCEAEKPRFTIDETKFEQTGTMTWPDLKPACAKIYHEESQNSLTNSSENEDDCVLQKKKLSPTMFSLMGKEHKDEELVVATDTSESDRHNPQPLTEEKRIDLAMGGLICQQTSVPEILHEQISKHKEESNVSETVKLENSETLSCKSSGHNDSPVRPQDNKNKVDANKDQTQEISTGSSTRKTKCDDLKNVGKHSTTHISSPERMHSPKHVKWTQDETNRTKVSMIEDMSIHSVLSDTRRKPEVDAKELKCPTPTDGPVPIENNGMVPTRNHETDVKEEVKHETITYTPLDQNKQIPLITINDQCNYDNQRDTLERKVHKDNEEPTLVDRCGVIKTQCRTESAERHDLPRHVLGSYSPTIDSALIDYTDYSYFPSLFCPGLAMVPLLTQNICVENAHIQNDMLNLNTEHHNEKYPARSVDHSHRQRVEHTCFVSKSFSSDTSPREQHVNYDVEHHTTIFSSDSTLTTRSEWDCVRVSKHIPSRNKSPESFPKHSPTGKDSQRQTQEIFNKSVQSNCDYPNLRVNPEVSNVPYQMNAFGEICSTKQRKPTRNVTVGYKYINQERMENMSYQPRNKPQYTHIGGENTQSDSPCSHEDTLEACSSISAKVNDNQSKKGMKQVKNVMIPDEDLTKDELSKRYPHKSNKKRPKCKLRSNNCLVEQILDYPMPTLLETSLQDQSNQSKKSAKVSPQTPETNSPETNHSTEQSSGTLVCKVSQKVEGMTNINGTQRSHSENPSHLSSEKQNRIESCTKSEVLKSIKIAKPVDEIKIKLKMDLIPPSSTGSSGLPSHLEHVVEQLKQETNNLCSVVTCNENTQAKVSEPPKGDKVPERHSERKLLTYDTKQKDVDCIKEQCVEKKHDQVVCVMEKTGDRECISFPDNNCYNNHPLEINIIQKTSPGKYSAKSFEENPTVYESDPDDFYDAIEPTYGLTPDSESQPSINTHKKRTHKHVHGIPETSSATRSSRRKRTKSPHKIGPQQTMTRLSGLQFASGTNLASQTEVKPKDSLSSATGYTQTRSRSRHVSSSGAIVVLKLARDKSQTIGTDRSGISRAHSRTKLEREIDKSGESDIITKEKFIKDNGLSESYDKTIKSSKERTQRLRSINKSPKVGMTTLKFDRSDK